MITKITRILPVLTFMIAVVILGLVLWPIFGDAPWEDGVTKADLQEERQLRKEAEWRKEEAERLERCDDLYLDMISGSRPLAQLAAQEKRKRMDCPPSSRYR